MRDLLRFAPLYQERVWGGRALETALERVLPPNRPIGESWELVDRPEAQSLIAGGALAGQKLRDVLTKHAADIMGPTWPAERPFPILVKWLDCRERLSLQVHPPANVAPELGGEPKTENWYIAATGPGAELIVGLKRGVTRPQFEKAIEQNTVESCVHHFRVAAGDSILVHSGQVHAIDAGNLILEIQQNSDTTYRVYDWGRVGLDGKPRQLHIAQSLRSIDWDDFEPAPVRAAPTGGVIADCAEFRIRRLVLGAGERLHLRAGEQPRIVSIVSGTVRAAGENPSGTRSPLGQKLPRGENVLVPYAGAFTFSAETTTILLVTENFAGIIE
ncbi:type I phosphomannose isomerase catalytic subunit [Opitutus sp. ER46]|uniref:type I phosphomannose isomerase catalytic subunit n=1 Tax=Opitutus sp. ER46 TaxID=2161864 RepID=UPI000D31129B|nr:type I phosphomannose isomerase catalytic subunit [Opitutus sp. ER46]PTX97931.1 mannose-6-phosphate isomerase [Opitutus sp. ER46]